MFMAIKNYLCNSPLTINIVHEQILLSSNFVAKIGIVIKTIINMKKISSPVTPLDAIKNNDYYNLLTWKAMFEALHSEIEVFISYEGLGNSNLEQKVLSQHDFQFENSLSSLVIFISLPDFMDENYYAGFPDDAMFSGFDAESDPLLYDECDIGCEPKTYSWKECYLNIVIAIDRYYNRLPIPEIFVPARRIVVGANIKNNKLLLVKNDALWCLPFGIYDAIDNNSEFISLVNNFQNILPKARFTNEKFISFFYLPHFSYEIRYPCMLYLVEARGELDIYGENINESGYFSEAEISKLKCTQEVRLAVRELIKYQKMKYIQEGDLD